MKSSRAMRSSDEIESCDKIEGRNRVVFEIYPFKKPSSSRSNHFWGFRPMKNLPETLELFHFDVRIVFGAFDQ